MIRTGDLTVMADTSPDAPSDRAPTLDVDALLPHRPDRFRTVGEVRPLLREACREGPDWIRVERIGESEEGRPLDAAILGRGDRRVHLVAGTHSDEPVGPETLRTLILGACRESARLEAFFEAFTVLVVPHVNPDGEQENRAWTRHWPDPAAFLRHRFRELPGRDLEFGYPSMRPENEAVAGLLREYAPVDLHVSLHGMSMGEGALLLIERTWIDRTEALRDEFLRIVDRAGLGVHDHDRGGEKGFRYIAPGFTTTPEGRAMQRHFREKGDPETAEQFHLSSMEYARKVGGDPLCLVTEFPLYLVEKEVPDGSPGEPVAYLELKDRLPDLEHAARHGREERIEAVLEEFAVRPLPLGEAVRLQLETLRLGLRRIADRSD